MQIFPGKQISLNRVGRVEISTVELPRLPGDDRVRYETCLFYDDAGSDVVAQYATQDAAIGNHNQIFLQELQKYNT